MFETQDGSHSIFSEKFGVSYHSKYGAIQESRHVFIEAGLYAKLPGASELSVLEIGFGTGLNALLTLFEAEQRKAFIHYEAIEAYPLSVEQARMLNYPQQLAGSASLGGHFLRLHELEWGQRHQLTPFFTFRKQKMLFEEIEYEAEFDLIYFDAFAPNAQPFLWEEPVLARMYKALKEEGILVTYCAKGIVKRRLQNLGFAIEALKGPPGKREMTRAKKETNS